MNRRNFLMLGLSPAIKFNKNDLTEKVCTNCWSINKFNKIYSKLIQKNPHRQIMCTTCKQYSILI